LFIRSHIQQQQRDTATSEYTIRTRLILHTSTTACSHLNEKRGSQQTNHRFQKQQTTMAARITMILAIKEQRVRNNYVSI